MIEEEKIEQEAERLEAFRNICSEAVEYYANLYPYQLPEQEAEKLINIVSRMFFAEIDYLQKNPDDYFELYGDEE